MPFEIERKYLVNGSGWHTAGVYGVEICQGYMYPEYGVVRIRVADQQGFITIKGQGLMTRREFEYEIPLPDANELIEHFCGSTVVKKTRYNIPHQGYIFSVDVFHELNAGLVLAEVELVTETDRVDLPEWIGMEVTRDPKYHNSNLIKSPFSTW